MSLYNTQSDGIHLERSREDGWSLWQIWTFRLSKENAGPSVALHGFVRLWVCYPSSYKDLMAGRADEFLQERLQVERYRGGGH